MQSIVEPFQKAVKRQKTLGIESDSLIDEMIANLSGTGGGNPPSAKQLDITKKLAGKLIDAAKDYQGALSKCSKAVEKKFKTDLDAVWDPKALDGKVSHHVVLSLTYTPHL